MIRQVICKKVHRTLGYRKSNPQTHTRDVANLTAQCHISYCIIYHRLVMISNTSDNAALSNCGAADHRHHFRWWSFIVRNCVRLADYQLISAHNPPSDAPIYPSIMRRISCVSWHHETPSVSNVGHWLPLESRLPCCGTMWHWNMRWCIHKPPVYQSIDTEACICDDIWVRLN